MRIGMNALASTALMTLALVGTPAGQALHADTPVSAQALPDIADLADKLLPSVVEISVQSKNPDAPQGSPQDSNPFKDFFDEFLKKKQQQGSSPKPDDQNQDQSNKDQDKPDSKGQDDGKGQVTPDENLMNSLGSGFIIDPKGIILTNNHVIADAVTIQVHLQDGTLLKAELVGHDPKTDIAVIKVKPDHDLPAVSFADSDKARVGQWVVAIGNPFGLGGSVSLGIVSARGRDINQGPYDDYLQTDAAINKGNSGGPLFDLKGNVVGINTAIFSPSGGSVGIGFAIPANEAKSVADQIVKFGETRRGWLGVKLQTLTPDVAEGLGMPKAKGALVADITAGGPSDKGGLKAGDVITSFDGKPVDDNRSLRRMVAQTEVGKDVGVVALRDGKEVDLKITLGRLEDGEKIAAAQDQQPAQPTPPQAAVSVLGMTLSDVTDDIRNTFKLPDKINGAVITAVAQDSAASDKGLAAGDVITEAGGKPVAKAQDVAAAVDQATKDGKNSVLALVAHGGNTSDTRFVALKLKK